MHKLIEQYGPQDYEIWTDGFSYYITDKYYYMSSRLYDEVGYCERAIDQCNVEWE